MHRKWIWKVSEMDLYGRCVCSLERKGIGILFDDMKETDLAYQLYYEGNLIADISKLWHKVEGRCGCGEKVK